MVGLITLAVALNTSHYQVEHYYCQKDQVVRSWQVEEQKKVLVVHPNLQTEIMDPSTLNCDVAQFHPLEDRLTTITMPGLSKGPGVGYYLSIDLCPSRKPLFNPELWPLLNQGVPVALSITKTWAQQHPKEWQKLLQVQDQHHNILWLNHTAHHRLITKEGYNPQLVPDLLENEEWLISQGQTPSLFYRLPGLLYTPLTKSFTDTASLIPVGAGAWLSKGQKPKVGEIILLHGNQNDPRGIKLLLDFIKTTPKIQWLDWHNLFTP
jgi:hypothetical protein